MKNCVPFQADEPNTVWNFWWTWYLNFGNVLVWTRWFLSLYTLLFSMDICSFVYFHGVSESHFLFSVDPSQLKIVGTKPSNVDGGLYCLFAYYFKRTRRSHLYKHNWLDSFWDSLLENWWLIRLIRESSYFSLVRPYLNIQHSVISSVFLPQFTQVNFTLG